jgi:outer membrane protein TolC
MKESKKRISLAASFWWYSTISLTCLVFSGILVGQELPANISAPAPQLPTEASVLPKAQFTPAYQGPTDRPQSGGTRADSLSQTGARIITLEEAQQKAAPANNPMVRLGQLQVEVARQTRLGTMSTFFPQIGSVFDNLHFNKLMGKELEVQRPITGGTSTIALPLVGQNQTFVAVTATQPITPLFQLRELYKINLADERIARAKAGMPVSETASKVEKAYYELLVAQRQLDFAKAKTTETENKWLVASNSAMALTSDSHDEELIETSNALAIATTQVKELTAALNEMLGWPPDTQLELVPPDPRFEDISLREATDKAFAANPEVAEAEQNVVKARSASAIQKLAYVPMVAAMGGYGYQDNVFSSLAARLLLHRDRGDL